MSRCRCCLITESDRVYAVYLGRVYDLLDALDFAVLKHVQAYYGDTSLPDQWEFIEASDKEVKRLRRLRRRPLLKAIDKLRKSNVVLPAP